MRIPFRKKTIVIIISLFVVIGGGLSGTIIYYNMQLNTPKQTAVQVTKRVTAKTVCTNDTLTQAAVALTYPQNSPKLEIIATDIMATTDYASDINCLYIVLQYNLAFSQATEARTNLTSIKRLYNKLTGYSLLLGDNTSLPEALEKMVATLETTSNKFVNSNTLKGVRYEPTN